MKQKIGKYTVGLTSIFMVLGFLVFHVGMSDRQVSALEQRNLQQIPEFSFEKLSNQEYQSNWQSYLQDQFPWRDQLFQAKVSLEHKLGKQHFSDVWIGEDDMLFQEPTKLTKEQYDAHLNTMKTIAKNYPKLDIRCMLVSNKASIYPEKLPELLSYPDQEAWVQSFYKDVKNYDIEGIDVTSILQKHKDEKMYYTTDHHWTTKAAYYAAKEYLQKAVKKPEEDHYQDYVVSDDFIGSLAKRSGYISDERDVVTIAANQDSSFSYVVTYVEEQQKKPTVFDSQKAMSENPYEVFFGGNHARIDIDTTSTHKKSLLVLKDSFANALLPYLLTNYSKITVVDPRYYNDDIEALIKERKITDVLCLYNVNTFFSDTSLEDLFE